MRFWAAALRFVGGCVAEDIPDVAGEEVVMMSVTCGSGDKVRVKESGKDTETDGESPNAGQGATYNPGSCEQAKQECLTRGPVERANLPL